MQQRSMKPSIDMPYNWKYAFTPADNEFHGDVFNIPSKNVSLSATSITDHSFPSEELERHFPKPAYSLHNSYSSKFCTSLHTTSDPHHHLKIGNNQLFLAHPCEPEYTFQFHLPTDHEDLAYHHQHQNQNKGPRHLELLEDVVAGNFARMPKHNVSATGTAQPVDQQLHSSHCGLIISNNENSRPDEICVATKGFISSNEERFDHNHSISGTEISSKPRIRWTQDLHGCFMRAVTDLGGADRATPKNIMLKMSIEGMTIGHVKSHLQKFRLARHQQQAKEDKEAYSSSEEKKTTTDQENNSKLTMHDSEILRMQWELQKKLHDQLEFQRGLQLRAEVNAQQLQKLLEEQKRIGQAFMVASQSLSPTCSATSPPSASPTTDDQFPARKGEIVPQDSLLDNNDHSFLPSSQKRARFHTDRQDTATQLLKRVHS